ncbi:MAG: response regulator transcription factor [Opitutaceae bacterium]|nr:response regulator transcription factor [Opitutaceae bacterium]
MPPPAASLPAPSLRPLGAASPDWVRRVVIAQWGRTYADALQGVCARAFPRAEFVACCSGGETLAELRIRPADVLLLALTFPDMDGVDLLPVIAREKLSGRVLVASHRREEHSLQTLRESRFDGLIDTLEESAEGLVRALRLVADGGSYLSPSLRDAIIVRAAPGETMQKLTAMETRVLAELGDGSLNPAVAGKLGISVATVQTHRRNLMRKLGISSSGRLVREAIRLGLVRITTDGRVIRPGFPALETAYPGLGSQEHSRRPA